MLRLRRSILTQILSPPATSHGSPLLRRLSAAVSPNPAFAVDDYLVRTCGLTRPQALEASAKISHLKSPAKPDAVLAFLAGLGLSGADVASAVAKDPKLLCAGVQRTLAHNVDGLAGLGLSRSEIASLVSLFPDRFRCRSIVSKMRYYLPLFGSPDNLLRAIKKWFYLLTSDLDRVVKPNVALFRECGLTAPDIAKLLTRAPRVLTAHPERVRSMVAYAEGIGVCRASGMFWLALSAVGFLTQDKIASKVKNLKNMLRWSDAEVAIAVRKAPMVLPLSKDLLQTKIQFLISEVGLEPAYIAHRPSLLTYSLAGRLKPRYYLVKFLKENGFLDPDRDYYGAINISEKVFMERFICPHMEAAPHLADDYADACKGAVPARFRSS